MGVNGNFESMPDALSGFSYCAELTVCTAEVPGQSEV
jgi:hypothetical protein